MRKRRITLNLDEDLLEAPQAVGRPSVSAVANDALRQAVTTDAHRAALLRWLDELDSEHGAPTAANFALADALLDEAQGGRGGA